MKLPKEIIGRNKIRDAAIVLAFKREGLEYLQIAERFKLTERRILQILSLNHAFIKRDKEWEKEKRISRLEKWIKNSPKTQKDPVDLQSELRKEIEGDKPNVSITNTVSNITYGWRNDTHRDSLRATTISSNNP